MITIATVAELLVKIGANSDGLRKEIQASQRQLKRAFGPESLELSQGAAGMLAGLATAMGLAGAASVKMAADFNANKTAFTQLLGDAAKAEAMLADLAKFAADTPFELPGVIDGAKKLLAFQFAAQDIIPIMAAVGNAVSLMGGGQEAIDGVVRALGQIQAKGKLSAEEMNQLTERGINGWKYIAEAMGLTTAEVMKLSEEGAIDATTAINAVVMGMQKDFKGGMAAMSKEIPGLLSTIKDNAGAVMREFGNQISTALDLKGVLQNAANYLGNFAAAVQSAGVKNAILGLVPPEATAAVFALGGALLTVAIPALYTFAGAMWLAIAPMAPYIALGAAIGILAYELWKNWEPLSGLFSGLWDGILANTSVMWNSMKRVFYAGVQAVLQTIQPLANLIGGDLQIAVSGWLESIPGKVANAAEEVAQGNEAVAASIEKIRDAKKGFSIGLSSKDISGLLPSTSSGPNTDFTGLHNTSNIGLANAKAAQEAAKEWEKLENKAKQVSEAIEREWVQTTQSELQQLDIWKREQVAALDDIKYLYEKNGQVYEDYQQNMDKVAAVYSARRIKILQQEAQESLRLNEQMRNGYESLQRDIAGFGLKGSAKDLFAIDNETKSRMDGVAKYYAGIQAEFDGADDQKKARILKNLDEIGTAYKQTEQGNLDFSAAIAAQQDAIWKQGEEKRNQYFASGQDIRSQMEAAFNSNSMAALQEALTAQNAIRLDDYAAQQSMMETWQQAFLAAHSTSAQLMADLYKNGLSGLTTTLSDIFSMTKSVGDAFQSLGRTMLKTITDYYAAKLAGQLMVGLFGKQEASKQTALDVKAGAATAAAWWPAAVARSLATAGANSFPAIAGMAAASAAGKAMSVPMLADGGITTGPTLAMIGEGRYQEAVIPLNRKALEKAGIGGSHEQPQPIHVTFNVNAIDSQSVDKFFKNNGEKIANSLARTARGFYTPRMV